MNITTYLNDLMDNFNTSTVTLSPINMNQINSGSILASSINNTINLDIPGYVFIDGEQIIPVIKDVKNINDKIVIISFDDNTEEKAICSPEDTFNFEHGVCICLMKKILSKYSKPNNRGTRVYNELMKYALSKKDAVKKSKQQEKEKIKKENKEKQIAREKENKQKRADMEYEIRIRKEATKQALKELFGGNIPSIDLLKELSQEDFN